MPQSKDSRIQILVFPDTRGKLSDDPRVQNQVVDEAQITWDRRQGLLSNWRICNYRRPDQTHIHPSQEKCRAWARGSSAKTECCCRKDADVCSILWRKQRAELITAGREERPAEWQRRQRQPRRQKHVSWGLEGAGEQRLHIYKAEREGDDFFFSSKAECHMLSVLTLELQHHITQVCLDVELIVRRQDQTETRRNRGYTRKLDWIFSWWIPGQSWLVVSF